MLEWLSNIDKQVFFAINGYHTQFLDWLMWQGSSKTLAAIVYISIAYLLVKQFDRRGWIIIAAAGLLFGISDQAATITKKSTQRLRPTHNPETVAQVNTVADYKGGKYSFYSGHASSSFTMCTFCFLILRRRLKGAGWLFGFAILSSISRIYLGVHWPSDIIVGILIGIGLGCLSYWALNKTRLFKVGGE
jgi:undecaprenyl-diphosphatase